MSLLIDEAATFATPSVSTLQLSLVTSVAAVSATDDAQNKAVSSIAEGNLLVDNSAAGDVVGSYSSEPGKLTLESASDSILSSETGESDNGSSGSLEQDSGAITNKRCVKLYAMIGSIMVMTAVVGSL